MKRLKDEEKLVGPMFPRLHVNDREKKGGPRAPPRNKMALYEQFSVPSQRLNPRFLPNNTKSSSSHTVPPSRHGNGHEKSYTKHGSRSYISCQSDGANSNTLPAQLEQRKEVGEGDFCVYINSRIGKSNDRTPGNYEEKLSPMGSRHLSSAAVLNDGDKDPTQFGSPVVHMRKDVGSESGGYTRVSSSRQQTVISAKDKSAGEIIDKLLRQNKVIPDQEDQDFSVPNISRLHQGQAESCLPKECVAGSLSNDIEHEDGLLNSTSTRGMDMDNGNSLGPRCCFHSMATQISTLEATNGTEYRGNRTGRLIQKGNLGKSGNVSKISIVENLSSLKVSPDDVVGLMGQKHFWKARREIANQQRVFAVQVFELHRLIKVQQLIAASPDFLLEDSAFIGKFPLQRPTCKNISLEVVIEPQPQNIKQQEGSRKLNNKMERSAENAVRKTSFSSLKNGSYLSNCTPFSGNPHQTNVAPEYTNPWCFNQSPGHQWLIPVMSPSEGLVYKPYPGPGFTGTMYGQCGPFEHVPHGGTFMNPPNAIPSSHPAIGVSPFIPPSNHAYFSPYGMPVMNQPLSGSPVEQVNQFPSQGSHGQNGHSSVEGANFNTRNQSSSGLPGQRNAATLHVKKFKVSKERGIQGSTASSPSEMTQGIRNGKISEERDQNSLSLNAASLASEGVLQSLETRRQTQVIKVVPHNARTATESAARIFQSIQQERKQFDLG